MILSNDNDGELFHVVDGGIRNYLIYNLTNNTRITNSNLPNYSYGSFISSSYIVSSSNNFIYVMGGAEQNIVQYIDYTNGYEAIENNINAWQLAPYPN